MMNGTMKRTRTKIVRDKVAKENLVWEKITSQRAVAKTGNYVLVAERVSPGKFAWEVWFGSEIVVMGDINGDCTTQTMAKGKATYRMRMHKQSLKVYHAS